MPLLAGGAAGCGWRSRAASPAAPSLHAAAHTTISACAWRGDAMRRRWRSAAHAPRSPRWRRGWCAWRPTLSRQAGGVCWGLEGVWRDGAGHPRHANRLAVSPLHTANCATKQPASQQSPPAPRLHGTVPCAAMCDTLHIHTCQFVCALCRRRGHWSSSCGRSWQTQWLSRTRCAGGCFHDVCWLHVLQCRRCMLHSVQSGCGHFALLPELTGLTRLPHPPHPATAVLTDVLLPDAPLHSPLQAAAGAHAGAAPGAPPG